jgi:hypothetical protein
LLLLLHLKYHILGFLLLVDSLGALILAFAFGCGRAGRDLMNDVKLLDVVLLHGLSIGTDALINQELLPQLHLHVV